MARWGERRLSIPRLSAWGVSIFLLLGLAVLYMTDMPPGTSMGEAVAHGLLAALVDFAKMLAAAVATFALNVVVIVTYRYLRRLLGRLVDKLR